MYSSSSDGKMRIRDLSLFQSNCDETICSGTGSSTGVLALDIVSALLKRASVVFRSLVLCYGSTLTIDQQGCLVFL
jgi:hypothetical protein